MWILVRIEELAQDMRYAKRVWMRSPGFAVTVIATIGLALGLNTGYSQQSTITSCGRWRCAILAACTRWNGKRGQAPGSER